MEYLENQENKVELMERFREGRRGLFTNIFKSRALDVGIDLVPFVGASKMGAEAAIGKTSSGRNLSPREKFDYLVASLGTGAVAALEAAGFSAAAGGIVLGKGAILTAEYLPESLKSMGEKIKNKAPRFGHMLESSGEYLMEKREIALLAAKNFTQSHGYLQRTS